MIEKPSNALPTAEELELWQFDLAKRIVRLGGDTQLSEQAQEAVREVVDVEDRQG